MELLIQNYMHVKRFTCWLFNNI